ncbi:SRPBCC family protein [Microbispora sp. NPDC046973]|uniref:SRPBCC family protein n=1 Tax=Microbispora sp. NPDC046973 TaxID=3155022 RepID=UPI0033C1F22D
MVVSTRPRQDRSQNVIVVLQAPSISRTISVAGLGAVGGMVTEYLFDPELGRSRRARVRDKGVHLTHEFRNASRAVVCDVANRSRGVVKSIRYRTGGRDVDDEVLHERVRAELGRYVRHPHAVEVRVESGRVTLTGDLLEKESRRACRAVASIPGVKTVNANWTTHRDATGVPRLQGEGGPRGPVPELLQQRWSPASRFLTGLAAALVWSLSGRLPRPLGYLLRAGSAVLALRAATNLPFRRLTGIGAGRRAIDIQDAITVNAPPQDVWPLLSDYSLFTRLMPDVLEVRRSADGLRSHWSVAGPAGVRIRFEAVETMREEGRRIAWKTVEGQLIAHTGTLDLTPENTGRSRIQVQLTYNPVFGAVGHAMAVLFGADPAHKLQEDLLRLKSVIEAGKSPVGAGPRA